MTKSTNEKQHPYHPSPLPKTATFNMLYILFLPTALIFFDTMLTLLCLTCEGIWTCVLFPVTVDKH